MIERRHAPCHHDCSLVLDAKSRGEPARLASGIPRSFNQFIHSARNTAAPRCVGVMWAVCGGYRPKADVARAGSRRSAAERTCKGCERHESR